MSPEPQNVSCAVVVVTKDGKSGKRFVTGGRRWCTIGTHKESDIQLRSENVAPLQALISVEDDGKVSVAGLDRVKPVIVSRTVSVLQSQKVQLSDGDMLRVGDRSFRIEVGVPSAKGKPDDSVAGDEDVFVAPPSPITSTKAEDATPRPISRRTSLLLSKDGDVVVPADGSSQLFSPNRLTLSADKISADLEEDIQSGCYTDRPGVDTMLIGNKRVPLVYNNSTDTPLLQALSARRATLSDNPSGSEEELTAARKEQSHCGQNLADTGSEESGATRLDLAEAGCKLDENESSDISGALLCTPKSINEGSDSTAPAPKRALLSKEERIARMSSGLPATPLPARKSSGLPHKSISSLKRTTSHTRKAAALKLAAKKDLKPAPASHCRSVQSSSSKNSTAKPLSPIRKRLPDSSPRSRSNLALADNGESLQHRNSKVLFTNKELGQGPHYSPTKSRQGRGPFSDEADASPNPHGKSKVLVPKRSPLSRLTVRATLVDHVRGPAPSEELNGLGEFYYPKKAVSKGSPPADDEDWNRTPPPDSRRKSMLSPFFNRVAGWMSSSRDGKSAAVSPGTLSAEKDTTRQEEIPSGTPVAKHETQTLTSIGTNASAEGLHVHESFEDDSDRSDLTSDEEDEAFEEPSTYGRSALTGAATIDSGNQRPDEMVGGIRNDAPAHSTFDSNFGAGIADDPNSDAAVNREGTRLSLTPSHTPRRESILGSIVHAITNRLSSSAANEPEILRPTSGQLSSSSYEKGLSEGTVSDISSGYNDEESGSPFEEDVSKADLEDSRRRSSQSPSQGFLAEKPAFDNITKDVQKPAAVASAVGRDNPDEEDAGEGGGDQSRPHRPEGGEQKEGGDDENAPPKATATISGNNDALPDGNSSECDCLDREEDPEEVVVKRKMRRVRFTGKDMMQQYVRERTAHAEDPNIPIGTLADTAFRLASGKGLSAVTSSVPLVDCSEINISEEIMGMNVRTLRSCLKENGLSDEGNKVELQERLAVFMQERAVPSREPPPVEEHIPIGKGKTRASTRSKPTTRETATSKTAVQKAVVPEAAAPDIAAPEVAAPEVAPPRAAVPKAKKPRRAGKAIATPDDPGEPPETVTSGAEEVEDDFPYTREDYDKVTVHVLRRYVTAHKIPTGGTRPRKKELVDFMFKHRIDPQGNYVPMKTAPGRSQPEESEQPLSEGAAEQAPSLGSRSSSGQEVESNAGSVAVGDEQPSRSTRRSRRSVRKTRTNTGSVAAQDDGARSGSSNDRPQASASVSEPARPSASASSDPQRPLLVRIPNPDRPAKKSSRTNDNE